MANLVYQSDFLIRPPSKDQEKATLLLSPTGDIQVTNGRPKLINQLYRLLKNDESLRNKLSFNGRIFAETHHDINKIASEYDKVFQSIINKEN